MKAIPQKPGPHGSRVVKKRTSYPRLGDGLANLLAKNGITTNHFRISAIDHEPLVCAGDGIDNHTSGSDPDTSPPAVKSSQNTPILPEKEDIELTTGLTSNPKLSKLGHTKFNTVLETSGSAINASILHGFSIEQRQNNAARDVAASTEVSIESATNVGITMYDSSFASSDDTPPDYGSTASGDGIVLSSPNSTPCTPCGDYGEQSIGSPAKGNSRVQSTNTPLFELAVDHVSQDQPTRNLMNQPSTHHTPPKDETHAIDAGASVISFHSISMGLGSKQVAVDCPVSDSHEKPLHMTLDDDRVKLIKAEVEANVLDSYEKGNITLPQAKLIARHNQLWILLAILEERESRSAAAFGMPTLSKCTEKVDEVTKRHANPVGLGQNIVPTSIFNPYTEWSDLKQIPTHQAPLFLSAEEIKIGDFIRKLNAQSFRGTSTVVQKPVHIFVDMSNIFIGFCDSWKISQGIPVQQFIRAPAFNFKVFASIMQRGRTAMKRILAGSVAGVANERVRWPRYLLEAAECGYEMNIFNRVQKPSPGKSKRRGRTPPQGSIYNTAELGITSGDESPEDAGYQKTETKNGEQGVDENLHLNMMNSMLDCMGEPATMVLATGDAAQAEFSGGFMQYATRALDRGWNLELITWKKTISSSWTASAFLERYRQQFRIIYLDAFLDELNADLLPCLTQGFESQWI
ncbi:hypothetical protein F5X99DRAFT_418454 [Biscogniauxia marginata]|nr:hypothetical protein F5X99DRAFT_418454 [Biscogniauxia marginata]